MSVLQTKEACSYYSSILNDIRKALIFLKSQSFNDSLEQIERIIADSKDEQRQFDDNEDILNDYFVILRYLEFVSLYIKLWEQLLNGKFSSSWGLLQNCLDLLRVIKRFSSINIKFFENQLLELEKTYPYTMFMSIGATVEKFECSLCGLDIDSDDCPHMRGELYSGKMAQAIARNKIELNHVSLVSNPKDKRCVVQYSDSDTQFDLVRYLSDLINQKKFTILDFVGLKFSKKIRKNPNYIKIGRNEPCFCGSGKKFKKCCISKEYVDGDHVDIIAEPIGINEVII